MKLSLFVNGDSHTAQVYNDVGPTATEILAQEFNLDYENIALPGGSNQRIIRTTLEKLDELDPSKTIIVIGWSSFERTEWLFQNQWHQICGDPYYKVSSALKQSWADHIQIWNTSDTERFTRTAEQHHAIWIFHKVLKKFGYKFLFYQGTKMAFFDGCLYRNQDFRLPWEKDTWVHDPYVRLLDDSRPIEESNMYRESFSWYVESHGCKHTDDHAHYGHDAHEIWANYMKSHLHKKINELLTESI